LIPGKENILSMPKDDKDTIQILSENLFPVIGVGASAGGLDAFKELVKAIPEDSGMAYIFIQHLSPQYESILVEILQKGTKLPVLEITDNLKVIANHIYIIPSNKYLTANDGVLQLHPRIKGEKSNTIDIFFISLAEIHQEHAIGIVFSGTGSDGTVGLKMIKDLGGITIAQDEKSASYFDMPKSAIQAEVVDYILSPSEIPGHLKELVRTNRITTSDINITEEFKEEEGFKQLLALLRTKKGVDFTYYKQTTIRRRILRRMALVKIEKLKEYQHYLLENKTEQDALFNDLLIPVTAFFRDPKIFDLLCEKIFPQLFKNKPAAEPIRIWSAGCATGEEAYSLAICLHEYFGEEVTSRKIQIFATDVSETVIAKARSGFYKKKDMAGVSEERIKNFFTKIDGTYQVNKAIRQMCVFACQNFLKDPPFAKMDLISCRNVLIYLEPYLQKKALNTFHYALNPNGFLLLGKSETIGQLSTQFQTFSQADKMYTKKEVTAKYMAVASEGREASLKKQNSDLKDKEIRKDDFQKAADDALLSKYAPVGVIINEQFDIIQFRGITADYLEAPSGKATHNILKMAREALSFELRNALHKSKSTHEAVSKKGIQLQKIKRRVDFEVIPLQNTIEPYFLVLFSETNEQLEVKSETGKKKLTKEERTKLLSEQNRVEQLEKELAQAREDMRSITEDQEAAYEELQSANEELLSGSEELQSLNEELETTKEEIQSSNEELTIVNQELIERNEQLVHSRKYAEAIVSTIHEPLIILTRDFHIKSANKSFYEKFNESEAQTAGKMFFELGNGKWNIPGLREKLQKILPDQSFFEKLEIKIVFPSVGERIMELNARQLLNENNNEQLILLAIQDVTDRKIFEQELELQVIERTKELKEANLNLQHSNENLQQFASIASHDLQEPLRKIKTFASILNRQFATHITDEGKEIINKIRLSADRMSELIKAVLRFSKIVHGEKEYLSTNLDEVLKNVMCDLDLLVSETKAELVYNKPLPQIDAIPLQMNQLFNNLLTNAIKFRQETVPSRISITSRMLSAGEIKKYPDLKEDVPHVEIQVADNGIGFDQQFGEQIFQIFERLHAPDEFEGTGVGLALCKQIVDNHHGHLFAKSKENEGAIFFVILPVNQK
jgi:two-component system, chemotaxis family, CheB/CheR fusion protein